MMELEKLHQCMVKIADVDLDDIESKDYMFLCTHYPHFMYRSTMQRLNIEPRRILAVVKRKEYQEYLYNVSHKEQTQLICQIRGNARSEKEIEELKAQISQLKSKLDKIKNITNNIEDDSIWQQSSITEKTDE